jgi:hypothetical protein
LCVSAAAKALPVLASKLGLALSAARSAPNFEADARRRPPSADFPDLALRCSLRACGELTLEALGGDADRRRRYARLTLVWIAGASPAERKV